MSKHNWKEIEDKYFDEPCESDIAFCKKNKISYNTFNDKKHQFNTKKAQTILENKLDSKLEIKADNIVDSLTKAKLQQIEILIESNVLLLEMIKETKERDKSKTKLYTKQIEEIADTLSKLNETRIEIEGGKDGNKTPPSSIPMPCIKYELYEKQNDKAI